MDKIRCIKAILSVCMASFLLLAAGCNQDDDPIVPSDTLPVKYVLPQGNERYDSLILEFYQQNEIFILYEYGQYDPFWNVQSVESNYRVVLPEKECLEVGINCLFDAWLNLYPPEFFKGRLPHYIYLADSLLLETYSTSVPQNGISTSISMTFANINRSLENMTTTAANTFKANVNNIFWTYIIDQGRFEVPEALDLDYKKIVNMTQAYQAGMIHGSSYKMNLQEDFKKTLDYLFRTNQLIIDMRFRTYPACKTRIQLLVDEMKRLYQIDLEQLTGKVLPHSEEEKSII